MLAKMWKKILLAVCIIACIFNLMSKLVNRHSLETNLESVNDGNTVLDAIKTPKTNEEEANENNVINSENINNTNDTDTNLNNEDNYIEENENANIENNQNTEENIEEETSSQNKTYKASDFTIIF